MRTYLTRRDFHPKDFPNLIFYIDSRHEGSITLNGSTVSQWDDLSGLGYDITQGVASAQPTYESSSSTLANRPSVKFDGTDDKFNAGAIDRPSTSDYYIVGVYQVTSVNATFDYLMDSYGGDPTHGPNRFIPMSFNAGSGSPYGWWDQSHETTGVTTTSATIHINDCINGSSGRIIKDGTVQADTKTVTANRITGITSFGAGNPGTNYVPARVGAYFMYERSISELERYRLERWLSRKWGISLAYS